MGVCMCVWGYVGVYGGMCVSNVCSDQWWRYLFLFMCSGGGGVYKYVLVCVSTH